MVRRIGKNILALGFLASWLFGAALPATAEVIEGSYWYAVDHITTVDKDASIVIWAMLPPDRPEQKIRITDIVPEPVAIIDDVHTGGRIVEWVLEPRQELDSSTSFCHFEFELEQIPVGYEIDNADIKPYDTSDPIYVKFTAPERWIQVEGAVLDQARQIVGDEANSWKQANRIFDWVMENLTFVPGGRGERDAESTLAGKHGDCGQYSALFTALCRSVGIPARNVTNVWTSGGAHVSAEIYLQDIGWVPMDTSLGQMLMPSGGGLTADEVQTFMSSKKVPLGDPRWLAGNLYSNRLITSVGNNVRFLSPTLGEQVSFQQMHPGGADAYPAAIQLNGLNRDVIHGGFFVFGRKVADEEEAHSLTHQRLARLFFREGLYDVVDDACRKSVEIHGDGIQNWINEGKINLHKGEYYKAEAAFKRAMSGIDLNRRDKIEVLIWTHNYLGNCYDLLGHREMALKEYQVVVELDNNYRGAVDYAKKYLKKKYAPKKDPQD